MLQRFLHLAAIGFAIGTNLTPAAAGEKAQAPAERVEGGAPADAPGGAAASAVRRAGLNAARPVRGRPDIVTMRLIATASARADGATHATPAPMFFARIETLVYRALRYAAAGHRLLPACAALSFAGTISAAYPVTAVVVPATLLAAGRWRAITAYAAIGSAVGATVLMLVFHHLGWTELYERFPELATNPSWARAVDWAASYGAFALFLIAASPLPQTPALMFFGAARPDYAGVFIAMLAGKLLKYGAFAWTASHFPERVGKVLGKVMRRRNTPGADDGSV